MEESCENNFKKSSAQSNAANKLPKYFTCLLLLLLRQLEWFSLMCSSFPLSGIRHTAATERDTRNRRTQQLSAKLQIAAAEPFSPDAIAANKVFKE